MNFFASVLHAFEAGGLFMYPIAIVGVACRLPGGVAAGGSCGASTRAPPSFTVPGSSVPATVSAFGVVLCALVLVMGRPRPLAAR